MTWAHICLAHSVHAIGSLLKVHPLKLAPSIHGPQTFPCFVLSPLVPPCHVIHRLLEVRGRQSWALFCLLLYPHSLLV